MRKIAFLTCDKFPELYWSDQILIPSMHDYGYLAKAEIWDNAEVDWRQYVAVIFRNTWDYYLKIINFNNFLDLLKREKIRTFNSIDIIQWNKHKFYLRELQENGFDVIPGVYIPKTEDLDIRKLLPDDWKQAILKPAISAGSYLTTLFNTKDADKISLNYLDVAAQQDLILQKFIPEIYSAGEISILYFDKKFSHAVRKTPKDGDFRIQSIYGGKYEPYYPSKLLLQTTQKIIDFIQDDLLYARVDGIIVEGVFYLMELELIEPDLYLDYVHNGTEKFADAIDQFMNKIKK